MHFCRIHKCEGALITHLFFTHTSLYRFGLKKYMKMSLNQGFLLLVFLSVGFVIMVSSQNDIPPKIKETQECLTKKNFNWQEEYQKSMDCINDDYGDLIPKIVRGDMEAIPQVIEKTCGMKDPLNCFRPIMADVEECLDDEIKSDLKITVEMVEKGIKFICKDEGKKLSNYISDPEIHKCFSKTTIEIQQCTANYGEFFKNEANLLTFGAENCRKTFDFQRCFEGKLRNHCGSSLVDYFHELAEEMLDSTPCKDHNNGGISLFLSPILLFISIIVLFGIYK